MDSFDVAELSLAQSAERPLTLTVLGYSSKDNSMKKMTLSAYSYIDFKSWRRALLEHGAREAASLAPSGAFSSPGSSKKGANSANGGMLKLNLFKSRFSEGEQSGGGGNGNRGSDDYTFIHQYGDYRSATYQYQHYANPSQEIAVSASARSLESIEYLRGTLSDWKRREKKWRIEERDVETWTVSDCYDFLQCIRAPSERFRSLTSCTDGDTSGSDSSSTGSNSSDEGEAARSSGAAASTQKKRPTMRYLYGQNFSTNDIDGYCLLIMDDDSMMYIGITDQYHRKKLGRYITRLKSRRRMNIKEYIMLKKLERLNPSLFSDLSDEDEEMLFCLCDAEKLTKRYLCVEYLPATECRRYLDAELRACHGRLFDFLDAYSCRSTGFNGGKLSIKLRITCVRHADIAREELHTLLAPVACAAPIPSQDDANSHMFCSIIFGPWLLEWTPQSLVIPKRLSHSMLALDMGTSSASDQFDLEIPLPTTSDSATVIKDVAELIVNWNTYCIYYTDKLPRMEEFNPSSPTHSKNDPPKMNSYDFVDAMLMQLGLYLPRDMVKGRELVCVSGLQYMIQEMRMRGFCETLRWSRSFKDAVGLVEDEHRFRSHEEIDSFLTYYFAMEEARRYYPFDYFLLSALHWQFWLWHRCRTLYDAETHHGTELHFANGASLRHPCSLDLSQQVERRYLSLL